MFQTELIKFLQSYSTDWLTDFMLFISKLGYSSFYIPVLIIIAFGLDFRKGFLLTQMMIWIGILTDLLKNLIALPRPADVDSGVKLLAENKQNPTPFAGMGGSGFWDLPDRETIEVFRSQPGWSFGMPSGHVSGTGTFWVGLSLLFRHAALKAAAIIMLILMPMSRMYLGRHFLADVLGGFLLGAGFLAVIYVLFVKPEARIHYLNLARLHLVKDAHTVLLLMFLFLTPLVFLMLSRFIEPKDAGRLFGLNAAFILLALAGFPDDVGPWFKRAGRVVLAFALYIIADWLVGRVIEASSIDADILWIEFLEAAIPTFVVMWGGVRVSLGLRLYSRRLSTHEAIAY